ncbi:10276_t:CDS:2, partial [Racocetra fulgida]
SEVDDLDKIANELGTSKSNLLNNDIIKDICVKQIKIWHLDFIDAIQFFYKITTNDKTYSIDDGEYIAAIYGKYGKESHGNIDELNFIKYIPSKKQVKFFTHCGKYNTTPFDMSSAAGAVYACFFGKCTDKSVTSIGMYEGKVHSILEQQVQLQQLSGVLFPNKPYDFLVLKQEIARLKYQDLAPQVRNEKIKFEELTTNIKTKAAHLEKVVDLLLETQKQAIKSNDQLIQGQLTAYKNILEGSLTKEELQILLDKQTELYQLEDHLANLQIDLPSKS